MRGFGMVEDYGIRVFQMVCVFSSEKKSNKIKPTWTVVISSSRFFSCHSSYQVIVTKFYIMMIYLCLCGAFPFPHLRGCNSVPTYAIFRPRIRSYM